MRTMSIQQARETIRHYFSQVPAATDPTIREECLTDEERAPGDAGHIARAEYLIDLFDNPEGEVSCELREAIAVLQAVTPAA
jgi:hypothetical protein